MRCGCICISGYMFQYVIQIGPVFNNNSVFVFLSHHVRARVLSSKTYSIVRTRAGAAT